MNKFRVKCSVQREKGFPITLEELIVSTDGDNEYVENFIKDLYYKVFSIKVRALKCAALKTK